MSDRRGITFYVLIAFVLIFSAGCEVLGIAPTTTLPPTPPIAGPDLKPSLPISYDRVMKSEKPKLLFFSSSYDPTSVDIRPYVSAARKTYKASVSAIEIPGDREHWSIAVSDHQVKYFPTVIVLDATGKETKRFEGYVDQRTIEKALDDAVGS